MLKNLMDSLKKQYEIYDIDDTIYDKLCSDAVASIIPDDSVNIDYQYYWQMQKYLDNYIISEIQKGNEEYKMLLSLTNTYIIKKYFNMKKISIDTKFIDSKYQNIKKENRLEKYYDDLSDNIVDDLKEEYDFDSTLNKQYVKQLNKKFNK